MRYGRLLLGVLAALSLMPLGPAGHAMPVMPTPPEVVDAEARRSVPELVQCLSSQDPFVVGCAAWALARVGDEKVVPVLNEAARRVAAAMVGDLAPPIASAATALELRLKGDDRSLRELARIVVESENDPVASETARVLMGTGQPLAFDLLLQARETLLQRGGGRLALRAAEALAWTKRPGTEAAIENLLLYAREGEYDRLSAAERRELQDAWWALTTEGMDEQQRLAAYADRLANPLVYDAWRKLREAGEAATPVLLGIVADNTRPEQQRGTAAGILGGMGAPEAEGELLGLLSDRTKGYRLRWPCAIALLKSGSEKGLAAVLAALGDPNEDVELLRAIPDSISKCDRPGLEEALTGLLVHPDTVVRMSSASALSRGGTGAYIDRAVEFISSEGVAEERRSVLDQLLANSAKHWTGPLVALKLLGLKAAPLARAAAASFLAEHPEGAAHADAIRAAILVEANEDALKAEVDAYRQLRGDEGLAELRTAADGLEAAAKEALVRELDRLTPAAAP